jgi:hypothetical protein
MCVDMRCEVMSIEIGQVAKPELPKERGSVQEEP